MSCNSAPRIACQKPTFIWYSRSVPRSGCCIGSARPTAAAENVEKMSRKPPPRARTPSGGARAFGEVVEVEATEIEREFRERTRGRVFRVGTLLVLAIVSAAIVIPTLLGSKAATQRVGVAGALSAPIRAAIVADGPAIGATVQLVAEPSEQAAAADLRAGRIDLAITDGRQVITDKPSAASDTSPTAQLTRAVARTAGTGEAMAAAGSPPRSPPRSPWPGRCRSPPCNRAAPAPRSGTRRT